MPSIIIRNIGPLKDTGKVELDRFNVFVGEQSSGKSTLMKLLCFCQWVEKQVMTKGGNTLYDYTHYSRFLKELKRFFRFDDTFFSASSEIVYSGEGVRIELCGTKNARIYHANDFETNKHNVKLSFIPAERNLVSAIRNVDRNYKSNVNDVLFNHVFEWGEAKEAVSAKGPVGLDVVGDMEYYYDASRDADVVRLRDAGIKISPFYASSGVQSVLPVVVLVDYLTEHIFSDKVDLSRKDVSALFRQLFESSGRDDDLMAVADKVSRIVNYQNAKIFIEEPEQSLFPTAQRDLLRYIVSRVNLASTTTGIPSSVTLTTHSPYVITAFNVLIKAAEAFSKHPEFARNVVADDMAVPISSVRAYYIGDGKLTDIVDREAGMIRGTELDAVSDEVEDDLNELNAVIYG